MTVRRRLVTRWGRRDRLAVVVVGLTTALLVGTTLLVAGAGAQATDVADRLGGGGTAAWYDAPDRAEAAAGPDDAVLPVATATVGNRTVTVVGVPPGGFQVAGRTVDPPPAGRMRGPRELLGRRTVAGDRTATTVTVGPRGCRPVLAPAWLVAPARAVEELGPTAALLVRPGEGDETGDGGASDSSATGTAGAGRPVGTVPVRGVFEFFLAGTQQLLDTLRLVAVGAGLLVSVAVYAVTRMTVRDRRRAIHVLRTTGAPPRTVLTIFGARAGLLTAVGLGLGYAVGVIATNAAASVAVVVGLPTSIDPAVTPRVARLLAAELLGIGVVGTGAGLLAARRAARRSPARLLGGASSAGPTPTAESAPSTESAGPAPGRSSGDGLFGTVRRSLSPTLLDARALVPTAATMSVFTTVAVVVAALAGTFAPLAAPAGSTVLEAGATHPVASSVDSAYAGSLRAAGAEASPEILLFGTVDGEPVLARGVNYTSFAAVSEVETIAGRPPAGPDEAVVGADLARRLGVGPGDDLLVGGSTRPGVARVSVVGVFAARGLQDDQLLVPLPTARALSTLRRSDVHVIRTDRPVGRPGTGNRSGDAGPPGIGVVAVDTGEAAGGPLPANGTVTVGVTVRNDAPGRRSATFAVGLRPGGPDDGPDAGGDGPGTLAPNVSRTVSVPPGATRRVRVTVATGPPGRYALVVRWPSGTVARTVWVGRSETLRLEPLPDRAPPNATLVVGVESGTGRPATDAAVRVVDPAGGNATVAGPVPVDGRGRATVPVPRPGAYRVVGVAPGRANASAPLSVAAGVARRPLVSVRVVPARPSVLTRPRARLRVRNPWNATLRSRLFVVGPTRERALGVVLRPGQVATHTVGLGRAAPGRRTVRVRSGGAVVAGTNYTVRGDRRVVSALATSGRAEVRSSGFDGALDRLFGNLEFLLATLVALAGLATVGGTTTTFASAVHARRHAVGVRRATGATPRAVLGLVLADALRLSVPATALALAAGTAAVHGLAAAGALTALGVSVDPGVAPVTLLVVGVVAVGLAVLGAAVAARSLIGRPPARLLGGPGRANSGPPDRQDGVGHTIGASPGSGLAGSEGHGDEPTTAGEAGGGDDD